MDSATRRIPPSEWDRWKNIILDLAADNSRKQVRSMMKVEHGFSASRSQYEAQLDIWENRKNLKRNEWEEILKTFDKISHRYGECRMLISGRPIPASRIQRARRYCRSVVGNAGRQTRKEGRSDCFRNVSIETLGSDGEWTPYKNVDEVNELDHSQDEASDESSSPNLSPAVDGEFLEGTDPDIIERPDRPGDDRIELFGMEAMLLHPNLSCISDAQGFDVNVVDKALLNSGDIDFRSSSSLSSTRWTNLVSQLSFPVPLDFRSFAHSGLDDLPFKRFKNDLEAHGIRLTSQNLQFPGIQITSMVLNPVRLFLEDVTSALSEKDGTLSDQRPLDATALLLSLKSLLPKEDLQGSLNERPALITEDEMLQTKFNQILLFSISNGFAGLLDIPIQSILKYLNRYAGIDSLLLRFMKSSRSHVAKALAENLFRAAIEAKNEAVLKNLLAIYSVDVDTTVCIVDGRNYTPVERSASLQDVGIVKLLVRAGADVNKTFAETPSDGGALASLINEMPRGTTFTPETIEVLNLLVKAGAKVCFAVVHRALRLLHSSALAYRLVSCLFDTDHSDLIARGVLDLIAEHLDDLEATAAIKRIILMCERMRCGRCLIRFEGKVEWAFVRGALRGHIQLVQLLLGYSRCPNSALSAAIRCGKNEVISTVLSSGVDIDAPAHNIDHDRFGPLPAPHNEIRTTALAEAIKAGDERLIGMIEATGSLKRLHEGGRFLPAIVAASKAGNVVYVRKLLNCCPSAQASDLTSAISCAIQYDHEEIFWTLLAAGADVSGKSMSIGPVPLLAAMLRRNQLMVRAILNAGIHSGSARQRYYYKSGEFTVFGEAVKWADESIIQVLRSAFPDILLRACDLSKALERGDMAWFHYLLGSGLVDKSCLTDCIEFALSRGDAELVHNLIERGADPNNEYLLMICTEKHPKMLPLLLKHIHTQNKNHIVPGYGTAALLAAINLGRAGIETVALLLNSGLVDAKGFLNHDDIDPRHIVAICVYGYYNSISAFSPLGLAIRLSRKGHHGDFAVIRKLLDAGCDTNSVVSISTSDNPGCNQTVLLEAIGTKSIGLVQLFISRGANVRAEATLGLKRTPLQKAVEVDSLEIVTLLLEAGADVNSSPATRGGATALQLAAIKGNCNIAAKLLEHGADLYAPPAQSNGRWPLEGAAEHGRLDMIEFIWKMGFGSFPQEQCQKATKLAEGNGHMACRDLIAELSRANAASLPEPPLGQWPSFETGLDLM